MVTWSQLTTYFMASLILISKFFKINHSKKIGLRYKIPLNTCRLDVRKNFYSKRIAKEWNCLSVNTVEEKVVITLENSLTTYMEIQNSNSN